MITSSNDSEGHIPKMHGLQVVGTYAAIDLALKLLRLTGGRGLYRHLGAGQQLRRRKGLTVSGSNPSWIPMLLPSTKDGRKISEDVSENAWLS